ncbi:MAG: DUF1286 domain-containing protein [Desulfurococcales archaeon]|nr:DUF1286 domain-containing protein [Desulfurococcales archaeon]
MRLVTHIVFALGVVSASSRMLGLDLYRVLILWGLTVVQHHLVDRLSHEVGHRRRTPLFHSPTGIIALSSALALIAPLFDVESRYSYIWLLKFFLLLLLSGFTHLMLDALNPGGVYFRGRRVRLSRIHYDDPLANAFFQLIGALLVIYSMYPGLW